MLSCAPGGSWQKYVAGDVAHIRGKLWSHVREQRKKICWDVVSSLAISLESQAHPLLYLANFRRARKTDLKVVQLSLNHPCELRP